MFRIAAVQRDKDGAVTSVIVDVETAIGKDESGAKQAFIIKHADELKGKEAVILVHPF